MGVLPVRDFEEYLLTWVSTVRNHENLQLFDLQWPVDQKTGTSEPASWS
jgi:hypothetical protein